MNVYPTYKVFFALTIDGFITLLKKGDVVFLVATELLAPLRGKLFFNVTPK